LKIVSEDYKLAPIGDVGEICIRSPITNSFLGYLENDEATMKAISRTGWVHTSDMGFIDHRGKLTILGRGADMIKRATVLISPVEVENVLIKHPDVKDVLVVGVPDGRLYEELCACVIPKENSILESSVKAFKDWMSRQLTPDEQGLSMNPKYLLMMKEFPKTNTGKSDRKATKTTAAQELELEHMG
jgi:fatty-acyl-CoA synthase